MIVSMNRRQTLKTLSAATLGAPFASALAAEKFEIDYVLSSALYGDLPLAGVIPEVKKSGSIGLDIWGKGHATHREEMDEIGVDTVAEMLKKHDTALTVSTRYPLGCFGLQPEMPVLKKLGGKILVCGNGKGKEPSGDEAKQGVKKFLEKMKPHADAAAEHGLVIALENHSNQLITHPDAIRYFAEFNDHPALGLSFAPHHLHNHIDDIPVLIRELGNKNIPFIYFQEHGIGSKKHVEKEIELEQLPGRGTLDYTPIVQALRDIKFDGVAEIFMHPTPRGTPMLETAGAITDEVNKSRKYIGTCLAKTK